MTPDSDDLSAESRTPGEVGSQHTDPTDGREGERAVVEKAIEVWLSEGLIAPTVAQTLRDAWDREHIVVPPPGERASRFATRLRERAREEEEPADIDIPELLDEPTTPTLPPSAPRTEEPVWVTPIVPAPATTDEERPDVDEMSPAAVREMLAEIDRTPGEPAVPLRRRPPGPISSMPPPPARVRREVSLERIARRPQPPTWWKNFGAEVGGWRKLLTGFVVDNLLWFLGAFCVLAGVLYFVLSTWVELNDTVRALIIEGAIVLVAIVFGQFSRLLGKRAGLDLGAAIFGGIAAALLPVIGAAGGQLTQRSELHLGASLLAWPVVAGVVLWPVARRFLLPQKAWLAAAVVLSGLCLLPALGAKPGAPFHDVIRGLTPAGITGIGLALLVVVCLVAIVRGWLGAAATAPEATPAADAEASADQPTALAITRSPWAAGMTLGVLAVYWLALVLSASLWMREQFSETEFDLTAWLGVQTVIAAALGIELVRHLRPSARLATQTTAVLAAIAAAGVVACFRFGPSERLPLLIGATAITLALGRLAWQRRWRGAWLATLVAGLLTFLNLGALTNLVGFQVGKEFAGAFKYDDVPDMPMSYWAFSGTAWILVLLVALAWRIERRAQELVSATQWFAIVLGAGWAPAARCSRSRASSSTRAPSPSCCPRSARPRCT